MIRRTLVWLSVGIALGVVLSMWLGPHLMSWRYAAPGQLASCAVGVQTALQSFVRLQLAFGAGLGLLLAVVAHVVAHARAKRAATRASTTSPS